MTYSDIEKLVDEMPEIVCSKDIGKLLGISEDYASKIASEMLPKSHGRVSRNKFWLKNSVRNLLVSIARDRRKSKRIVQKKSTGCEILSVTSLGRELGILSEQVDSQVKRGKIPPPKKCETGKYWLRKDLIAAKVLDY